MQRILLILAWLASGLLPAFAETPLPRARPQAVEAPAPIEIDPVMAREPREASACQFRLAADRIANVDIVPSLSGPGGCGAIDAVRLKAVTLPGGVSVPLTPPAILRCEMAEAIAHWVREDVAPLASALGAPLRAIDNYDSYECRGRNRIANAKLSEHGRANALDVRGLRLANGTFVGFTDRHVAREFRETMRRMVCARFMTVLGPGSDGFHEEHVHLDLAERARNYRLCQWDVLDPVPDVPLPRPRPAEAAATAEE